MGKPFRVLSTELVRKIVITSAVAVLPMYGLAPYTSLSVKAETAPTETVDAPELVLDPVETIPTEIEDPVIELTPVPEEPVELIPTDTEMPTMMLMQSGVTQQSVLLDKSETQSSALSKDQEITDIFVIEDLERLTSVTSNTGTVEVVGTSGNEVTVKMNGGDYFKRVQVGGSILPAESKEVIEQDTAIYDDGEYTGTLEQYVFEGQLIPEDVKYAEVSAEDAITGKVAGTDGAASTAIAQELAKISSGTYSVPYVDGDHSGTLVSTKETVVSTWVAMEGGTSYEFYEIYYVLGGNVTKPSEDTRVYKYRGTVVKPEEDKRVWEHYYKYDLTFNYQINSSPEMDLPEMVQVASNVSPHNVFTIKGSAQDLDGDSLKLVYSVQDVPELQNIEKEIDVSGSFEEIVTLPGNLSERAYLVDVHTEDVKGNRSAVTQMVFYSDVTAPTLALTGANESDTFYGTVSPNITPTDNISSGGEITLVSTLNDAPYVLGTPIKESGSHVLTVVATDKVGNSSTTSYTIKVNSTPKAVKPFENITTGKYQETEYSLVEYFADADNDSLSLTVSSTDTNVAEVELTADGFKIVSKLQGTAQILIEATDGHTSTDQVYFEVSVGSAAPILDFPNKTWLLVDGTTDLTLAGTVMDNDKEDVEVTGSFNGVTKTATIATTGGVDQWTLTWSNVDVPTGVTDSGIPVNSLDAFGGLDAKVFDKVIVKVSGEASDYMDAVNQYQLDKSSNANDWTSAEHKILLDAFEGMKTYKAANTAEALFATAALVNIMDEGLLKEAYNNTLNLDILDIVNNDIDKITEDILDAIGIDNVNPDLIDEYKDALKEYEQTRKPLSKEDIQNVIDAVNAVEEARKNPSQETINKGFEEVSKLEDGPLKDRLLKDLEDITIEYIANNPDKITQDLLDHAGLVTDPDLLDSYKEYFEDVLGSLPKPVTKEQLQDLIDVVNDVWAKYRKAIAEPSQSNVIAYETAVKNLQAGNFKTKMTAKIGEVAFVYLVDSPSSQDETDYERLSQTIKSGNLSSYNENISKYIMDLSSSFTYTDVSKVISITDKVLSALTSSAPEEIKVALTEVKTLSEGTLKADLIKSLTGQIIGDINTDPSKTTPEDLIDAGIDNVNPDLIDEYKDALEDLKKDKAPDPLTQEDIQLVIDAVNAVIKAEGTKLKVDITDAYVIVNKLPNGNLKDKLIDRLEAIVLDQIISKPEDITKDDLVNGGFEGVVDENLDEYKDSIKDMIDELGPLTKEQIQDLINAINAVKVAKANTTEKTITDARVLVDKLPNSRVKTKLNVVLDELWESIKTKPTPTPTPDPTPTPPPTDNNSGGSNGGGTSGGGSGGSVTTPPTETTKPPTALPSLPDKADNLMMGSTSNSQVIISLAKNEVAVNEPVKLQIKVKSVKDLKDSKLKMYVRPNSNRVASSTLVASLDSTAYIAATEDYQEFLEINITDLLNGSYENSKTFKFAKEGDYDIKAVFENIENSKKETLETNAVQVAVADARIQIPNTKIPNVHGLAVATLKIKDNTNLYTLGKDGKYIKAKAVKKGTSLLIQDTTSSHYKLHNGLYAEQGSGSVHIGKGEVRKDKVSVYDKEGNVTRTIKKGQQYKVYAYDQNLYSIGGGEFIEAQNGVTYVFGWVLLKENMKLYNKDGAVVRVLKAGEKYRVYSANKDNLDLGAGLSIKREVKKFKFIKN